MDDKQLLEDHFLSYDYTKPEEYEKREYLRYNKSLVGSNGNSGGGGNRSSKKRVRRVFFSTQGPCIKLDDYTT